MWRVEAGEGFVEGTAFVAAAVITSKTCSIPTSLTFANYQNTNPSIQTIRRKNKKQPTAKRQINIPCCVFKFMGERLTCGLEERLEAAGGKTKKN